MGPHLQLVEVDVRLIEAVEEDEPVGAGLVEPPGRVGEIAEEGELDGTGCPPPL
jgi:hypothetical protein